MFYNHILGLVLKNLASNFDIEDYRKKINKFVKSKALLQLFDENYDNNDIKFYICLIRDEYYNYYFVILDRNFNYRCHTNIYDTVYNYIKFDEYIKYNKSEEFIINDNILDEIELAMKSKFNIVMLGNINIEDKINQRLLLVKLQNGNYIFIINDINKLKILKYIKI
jgi:hypothetical protein